MVGTLLRSFPQAAITELKDTLSAVAALRIQKSDAVICIFEKGIDAIASVHLIRGADRGVPILVMSEAKSRERVSAAGATAFLDYERWLLVGTVAVEMMTRLTPSPGVTS